MSDEEWADPYATIEDEKHSETSQTIKQDLPQVQSKLAQILETETDSTNIYDFKNTRVRIRDLYWNTTSVIPFDFSTPSPDDLWRLQKKKTIIRKK